jgi:transposase
VKKWTTRYYEWLNALKFDHSASRIVYEEYMHQLTEIQQRLNRFEEEIERQAIKGVHAPMIQALQTLRGVAVVTAASLVAEVGSFQRFSSPKQFMAYVGLIPSESSSGDLRRQGKITKTGNRHVRRLLIESAWSYRYPPAVKGKLKKRQEGQPPEILQISWKAQTRLNKRYFRLLSRGKVAGKAITAVARELSGFIWAITQEIEREQKRNIS